jgi:uncharacterized protein (DUF433 family)
MCVQGTGATETGMELESYFDFVSEDTIRIKGTRVGIETVLEDYLQGAIPEEIAARYRTLSLEQVYATITYYLHYRAKMDAYLESWRRYADQAWLEQQRNPSEFVLRFLLDEHMPRPIQGQLLRLSADMDVLLIGQPNAPIKGTPDPDLLRWIERLWFTSDAEEFQDRVLFIPL